MKSRFEVFYIALIILCANEFLNFGWWWHVQGVFNVADVGNLLVWMGLAVLVFKKKDSELFWTQCSILILFYLLFVLIQIALASLYYNQSLLKGLIGTRHQFYYASFFLFLFSLDTTNKIRSALNMITLLAIIALTIGIINYFGTTILTHKWAEGHGVRSGDVRCYVPAMSIVSLALIWELSKWISKSKSAHLEGLCVVFLLVGHFFRQTRMRIFGVVSVILILLLLKRKFKLIIITSLVAVLGFAVSEIVLEENIVLSPFKTAAENLSKGTGSWRGRLQQMRTDFQEFSQHPLIGSGSTSLRLKRSSIYTSSEVRLWGLSYKADLGYTHWLKAYGILGMIWLSLFLSFLFMNSFKILKQVDQKDKDIGFFLFGYSTFIIATFITLNHMMFPHSIPLVCLLAAVIARMKYSNEKLVSY